MSLAVDSATRLTAVLVEPVPSTRLLMLGEYVNAVISVNSGVGLVVPRSALLPFETGVALYAVHNGRAYQRVVNVGVETDSLVQVSGAGLQAGDTVVVLGNYELTDSMRVRLLSDTAGAASAVPNPKVPE